MNNTYLIIFIVIFLTFLLNFFLNIFSHKYYFLSYPTKRSVHKKGIPFMGGFTISLILLIVTKNLVLDKNIEIIILFSFFVMIIGLYDDILIIKPEQKIIFICLPVFYLIFIENIYLIDLGEYEFIGKLYLGKFATIFTFLAVLLLINSYNYIDGVDGLIITQSLIFFCYMNYLIKDSSMSDILLIMTAIYLMLLICNFSNIKNIKTFIGNCGSLMTGYLIAFFAILAFQKFQIHPIKIIYALSYPVYDFLRVNISRIITKKKLFEPNKDHLHHLLLKKVNYSHLKVTLCSSIFTFGNILAGNLMTNYFNNILSLILFVINFFIFCYLVNKNFK